MFRYFNLKIDFNPKQSFFVHLTIIRKETKKYPKLFIIHSKDSATMKRFTRTLLIVTFSVVSIFMFAQDDCKVLKAEIADNYSGKCKKGLAHGKGIASGVDTYEGQFKKGLPNGKGTYIWSTGEKYIGEFKAGLRHGEGVFVFMADGNESALDGIWEEDQYIGKKVPKPKVTKQQNIDRYTLKKVGNIKNRVLVDLFQNGSRNVGAEDLLVTASSGYQTWLNYSKGFEAIDFPVTIKVRYTTWNKLRTYKLNAVFEFEIFEPGDWKLDLFN